MRTPLILEAINRLTFERGEKRGNHYYAVFSCKDVLDYMDFEVTPGHLRHVAYIATRGYPESSSEPGSKQCGRVLNMKIRTK